MTPPADLFIRNVEIMGKQGDRDVVIRGGVVSAVVPKDTLEHAPRPSQSIEGAGGLLLPGLHDHHIHLMSMAARATSLDCTIGSISSNAEFRRLLEDADGFTASGSWLRGVGYDDQSLGRIDRAFLDSVLPDRPARIQHRTGHAWILNSAAFEALNLNAGQTVDGVELDANGAPTGWVFGADAHIRRVIGSEAPSLSAVSDDLARFGITAVTDATLDNDDMTVQRFDEAVDAGELQQRIHIMGRELIPGSNTNVGVGPVKIVLAEHRLPGFRQLVSLLDAAHRQQKHIAIHAVSREAVLLALVALEASGRSGCDRIEHASLVPDEALERMANLGVTVVTQFNFLRDHGDLYVRQLSPDDLLELYRGRSWLESGIALAGGSDAPFGSSDPWLAMRAAVERRTSSGVALTTDEALSPERALGLYLSPLENPGAASREVAPDTPADLCLLRQPWSVAKHGLSADLVSATIIAGRIAYVARGDAKRGEPANERL